MSNETVFRFWSSKNYGIIRQRSGPKWSAHPEIWRKGRWITGSPYVMDAITGMGEDGYSCGGWADEMSLQDAQSHAAEKRIDLYGSPESDD